MSESSETPIESPETPPDSRCPQCDSVVSPADIRCLMCGHPLASSPIDDQQATAHEVEEADQAGAAEVQATETAPAILASVMRERQSRVTFWFTAVFAVIIVVLGALVLRYQGPVVWVAFMPTETTVPPTETLTPTWTPLPTTALQPTATVTWTPSPAPSETPPPPQIHTVNSGETLIGLALRYRVSVESIAALNGLSADAPLRVQEVLRIPWPTPTPPLIPVAVTVRGISIVADPTDCDRYEVRGGDSLSGIAAQLDIDFELLIRVNRMTEETLLQPGDTLCIPEIVIGGALPPTPGPSPTISPTPPPAAPQLLYPVADAQIEPANGTVTLQWAAVKDLTDSEWYMVEMTDIDDIDSLPRRGFTRDTAFQLPPSWRPDVPEVHQMRWRVSIVQVTGQRADGAKIYTFGGLRSRDAFFYWLGAVPTATPTPTPTMTPEA